MKINLIHRDITLKQCGFGAHIQPDRHRESGSMRGYNAEYCGSFTGKSEAATSFIDKILSKNWFGNFSKYAHEHNISTSALIALVLAGVMRPATIMALPGKKDKEDKIYASGHAMASGILGFIVSTAITSPFDESIKKIFDDKKFVGPKLSKIDEQIKNLKDKNILTEADKLMLKNLKSKRGAMNTLAKNIPDWFIAVPRAMLTIALIPPILKYVFGVEKKKKAPEQKPIVETNNNKVNDFIEKPVFSAFKGGVR